MVDMLAVTDSGIIRRANWMIVCVCVYIKYS